MREHTYNSEFRYRLIELLRDEGISFVKTADGSLKIHNRVTVGMLNDSLALVNGFASFNIDDWQAKVNMIASIKAIIREDPEI